MAAKLTPEQRQNIVDRYLEGMSGAEIAKKFKHSTATIAKVLREEGVQVVKGRNNRWYKFNEHYLDELDCANKFWFLGYFYADGYWAPKGNVCSIDSVDKDAVEKCRKIFESNRPLQLHKATKRDDGCKRQDAWSFRLNSPIIHQKLNEYGCDSEKSFTAEFPKHLFEGKEEFVRDFVRGLFDGDGSFSYVKKETNIPKGKISIVGTEALATQLGDWIENHKNWHCTYNRNKKNVTYLELNRVKDIEEFIRWIYYEGVENYMERKYKLTQEYLLRREEFDKHRRERFELGRQKFKNTLKKKKENQKFQDGT